MNGAPTDASHSEPVSGDEPGSILHMKRPRNGFHPGSQLRYLVGRITTVSPQVSRNASTRFSIPVSRFRFSVREIKLAALA
jgi:hypothetical protein